MPSETLKPDEDLTPLNWCLDTESHTSDYVVVGNVDEYEYSVICCDSEMGWSYVYSEDRLVRWRLYCCESCLGWFVDYKELVERS